MVSGQCWSTVNQRKGQIITEYPAVLVESRIKCETTYTSPDILTEKGLTPWTKARIWLGLGSAGGALISGLGWVWRWFNCRLWWWGLYMFHFWCTLRRIGSSRGVCRRISRGRSKREGIIRHFICSCAEGIWDSNGCWCRGRTWGDAVTVLGIWKAASDCCAFKLLLLAVHRHGHLVLYMRLIDGRSCYVILGIVTVALCNP